MLLLSFILKREARENYFHYGETIDSSYNTIVFRDLPTDLDSVKQSLKHLEYSQLYLVLHHQHSIYFEGLPSSHLFKQSYKALFIRKEMNLEKEGLQLCQYLNIKPNTLKFILKVFLDLSFIYEENGIIKINDNPSKQSIESSQVYKSRQSRIEVEKLMLYDDFSHLKNWIKAQKA